MRCKEFMEQVELVYPLSYAESWDNVGLLVGRKDKEIQTIYVALDATEEVISHAVSADADLLLTHHPMIFSSLKTITDSCFVGRRIIKLLQQDMACYAMHTNYDVLRMGELAAQMLLLQETRALEITAEDGNGIGKIGKLLGGRSLDICTQLVKETFSQRTVKVFGDKNSYISKVALVPGSGGSYINRAIEEGADLLITGDVDYHEGIDAVERGLSIIDAGHYGIEHIFMEDVKRWICSQFEGIHVVTESISQPCYFC